LNIEEFLKVTAETLEYEEVINIDDRLEDIDMWDSLGVLSLVGMLDEMNISVELDRFEDLETIREFIALAGISDD
jgi:acyl carrier protein|tara:strand:- start:29 stop:253 length:225 start_codon:yes stop_codon:yes gene_type:complete